MCLLFDENFEQGRSVDFLFLFLFFILFEIGYVGQVNFFFTPFFFTIYVPRFGKKKINDNANYLVCFVIHMIQAWTKEY